MSTALPRKSSEAELLASLPEAERTALLRELPDEDAARLLYDWTFWARPNQLAPSGDWFIWLVLAGRGWGKTKCGAEWVRDEVESGRRRRLALIGPTAADVRDLMVEHGKSSILRISRPEFMPDYEPSKRRLTWPNGATALLFSAQEPERMRGGGWDGGWCDELAAWERPEIWDLFMFTLRERPAEGHSPQIVVTTTPKPIPLVKALLQDPTCVVTRGSTFENSANLDRKFLSRIISRYEGTRLGRQELHAEVLEDTPGALWTRGLIDRNRVKEAPPLVRIVVAIDPAATSEEGADDTGIVAAGVGKDGHGYVLEDASLHAKPDAWARAAVALYHRRAADRIVAEVNNGGEMVELTVRTVDEDVPYTAVHASRGKQTRAEPISALYEQGRIHHVGGFAALEDEMTTWVPGMPSPDRMDALVWALTELMLEGGEPRVWSLNGPSPKEKLRELIEQQANGGKEQQPVTAEDERALWSRSSAWRRW